METDVTSGSTADQSRNTFGRVARRLESLPLGLHAALLAGALLVLMPVVGTTWLFSADEGAVLAQVELVLDGTWTMEPALADSGVDAVTFEGSTSVDDELLPFPKHPGYPLLLTPFQALLGSAGSVLVSVLGTVFAAWGTGALTRSLLGRLGRTALWTTGVASPLFFDGYLVIAHTIGAALVAWGTVATVRAAERRANAPAVGAFLLFFVGALLRNELVLLGGALSVAMVAWATVGRRVRVALIAAIPAVAVVAGYLLDPVLLELAVAESQSSFVIGTGSGEDTSWLVERVLAFVITVILPAYSSFGVSTGLAALVPVASAVMVWIAYRRPDDEAGIVAFGGLAVLASLGRLVLGPASPIPGLFIAFPIVPAGIVAVLLVWRTLDERVRVLFAGAALFGAAIMATQYASGGSGEWGGRYLAVGIPLAVPPIVVGLHRVLAELGATARRSALVALVTPALCLAATGVVVLRDDHSATKRLVDAVEVVQEESGAGAVLTTEGFLPRANWRDAVELGWVMVAEETLEETTARLIAAGRGPVVVVWRGDDELLPGGHDLGISTWRAVVVSE